MYSRIILTLTLLISLSAFAEDKISNVIKELSPQIDSKTAERYAIIIRKYSKQFNVDWKVVCAIFKQESNFRIQAINPKSQDYGIGQINYKNILAKRINISKLVKDPDYAIKQTFLMLQNLKKAYSVKDSTMPWYTRYHSFSMHHRKLYDVILNRWLQQIERILDERQADQFDFPNYLPDRKLNARTA